MSRKTAIIIGAGPAGLTAAFELIKRTDIRPIIFEKTSIINIPKLDAYTFGYLTYFFEKACAVSGYVLDVNPFNQPGVEAYKRNMFALLGKPGYEDLSVELKKRLK